MNWDMLPLKKITCTLFAVIMCISYNTLNSHTDIEIRDNKTLLTLYTLDNKTTNLVYHLNSGTVYKKGKRGLRRASRLRPLYTHAHIISSKPPPQGKVLGIINKPTSTAQEKYYVYVK